MMSNSKTNLYSKTFGRLFNRIRPEIWGFIGSGILLAFVLLSRIGYVGSEGEAFSFFNHYISELGEVGVSHLAPLCNTGLILGGLISVLFMVGLGMYIKNSAARIAMGFGVLSGIACSLVGFFPMNNFHMHIIVAASFFLGGMITVAIFTVAILMQKEVKISKLFGFAGLVVTGIFIAFLVDAHIIDPLSGHVALGVGAVRPHIWMRTILEWSVYFAIVGWILAISTYMYIVNRRLRGTREKIQP